MIKIQNHYIEIADNGIGIPTDELSNITKPFYRASNSDFAKGTGIGLALSKDILNRLNAKMELTSEIGKGTTVVVRFI